MTDHQIRINPPRPQRCCSALLWLEGTTNTSPRSIAKSVTYSTAQTHGVRQRQAFQISSHSKYVDGGLHRSVAMVKLTSDGNGTHVRPTWQKLHETTRMCHQIQLQHTLMPLRRLLPVVTQTAGSLKRLEPRCLKGAGQWRDLRHGTEQGDADMFLTAAC